VRQVVMRVRVKKVAVRTTTAPAHGAPGGHDLAGQLAGISSRALLDVARR